MKNEKIPCILTRAERLREINETITAGILARRYARTREERAIANAILERAYEKKWELLGV